MLAQTVVCPGCRTELKLKAKSLAGRTEAPCPVCKVRIPLAPAVTQPTSDTDASVADRTQRAPGAPPLPQVFAFLAPPRQPDEIGRLAHYRVLGELGRGGMGVVFRAEDAHLRRPVALKVMLPQYAANPTDKARFLREARAQAQVEHDHVATIFQVGEDRVPYLAMPLLKGLSLSEALRANPLVPLPSAVRIAREMAEGLAAAHEKGLIHRDIKPGNVWLEGKQLRVKILDFGLARAAAATGPNEAVTQQGAVVGTPAYMSPEQARGEPLDARSDLFSLGTVLYQMMTGRQPFRSSNTTAILIAVATEQPPNPATVTPAVPPALDALTMALLAKDPAFRPQTAEDVAGHLRAIEAEMRAAEAPASGSGYVAVPMPAPAPGGGPNPWSQLDDATEAEGAELQPVVSSSTRHTSSGRHAAVKVPARRQSRPSRRPVYLAAAAFAAVLALGITAIAAYLLTDTGTVAVEITDAETESRYRSGRLVLAAGGRDRYTLTAADRTLSVGSGTYTVRIDGAEVNAEPREISVKRGEPTKVWLTAPPKPATTTNPPSPKKEPAPNRDADRRGAEFVIRAGGGVRINGGIQLYRNANLLPAGDFRLTYVDLTNCPRATDDGLAALKDCRDLTGLMLSRTPVTDAGLAHFKDHTEIADLWLANTAVGDAGLAHLKNCKRLANVNLSTSRVGDAGLAAIKDCKDTLYSLHAGDTRVTDAGLAHFAGTTGLTYLNLMNTAATDAGLAHFAANKKLGMLWLRGLNITDAGLAHFAECVNLAQLSLADTPITDAGLAHFKNCKSFGGVYLNGTKITDAGLEHLKGCPRLTLLYLGGTKVTDAGLEHLRESKSLSTLNANNTGLTDAAADALARFTALSYLNVAQTQVGKDGVAKLRKELPNCTIDWNGGTVGARIAPPGGEPDRVAAEYVIDVGGSYKINNEARVRRTEALPAAPFSLTYVSLFENKKVTDAGLAALAGCRGLKYLSLNRTTVGDAGVAHLKDCRELTGLYLQRTRVTDAGLAVFDGLTTLHGLNVAATAVTDAGLAYFKDCKDLKWLHVYDTAITDAGLAPFGACKDLATLGVYRTAFSDAGAAHFKDCKEIADLWVNDTKITDAGLVHFKGCKNLTQLYAGGNPITDAGLANFKDCPGLTKLSLGRTKVTDAGLAHFAGRRLLNHLSLSDTPITDAGLAHFADCPLLAEVWVNDTAVTDAGLAHFKDCLRITLLSLANTKVTDAGVTQMVKYRSLSELNLSGTPVTDAAVAALSECKSLTSLNLTRTKVTADGVAELRKALPACRVEWDN